MLVWGGPALESCILEPSGKKCCLVGRAEGEGGGGIHKQHSERYRNIKKCVRTFLNPQNPNPLRVENLPILSRQLIDAATAQVDRT